MAFSALRASAGIMAKVMEYSDEA
jgi:hypothetical protein